MQAGTNLLGNIGLYSYGTALLAYIMLVILAFISRRGVAGRAILAASVLTVLWAGTVTLSTVLSEPLILAMSITEVLRNAGWAFVLLRLIGVRMGDSPHILATGRWLPAFGLVFALLLALVIWAETAASTLGLDFGSARSAVFIAWVGMSIMGMLLLEQLFRNSTESELWSSKHLCLGLGIIFAFDFFMYAEALLFRILDSTLWQARGLVTAMAAILIATSLSRAQIDVDEEDTSRLQLSRHVAFHSLTLMASGIYLITMALAAYFIRFLGGSWGAVLQIVFLCGAGLTLVVLLFSGQIRASVRVWLSKNFFSYKYDYRHEWLHFTRTLASGDTDIPGNIIRAIARLAQSPAGILWSRVDRNRYAVSTHWNMPLPPVDSDLYSLPAWLEETEWIIDLREWRISPDIYRNLEVPQWLVEIPRAWLVIPLLFGDRLQGILLLQESDLLREINWEDRDLLKVAGRQAASHLAQYEADQALVESRQFEAFNRLSAYVIHDLKNILAQLSLMVSNAQKHKNNPDFIDDMVGTVNNSVERMSRLMAQLRSGEGQKEHSEFALGELLESVAESSSLREPVPNLQRGNSDFTLNCDRERLHTVFNHLVQNAQDATDSAGNVTIRLLEQGNTALVEIEDDGVGMDEQFIRHRLFKPFDSTKGLTGMGIGVFESRDFIRSLGGDISVQSRPGEGSVFRVFIPGREMSTVARVTRMESGIEAS